MDNSDIEDKLGFPLKESQAEAAGHAADQARRGTPVRLCLYHRTGEGKTIASLACVAQGGAQSVLVLAPPVTHPKWVEVGATLGVHVTPVSHAKFRMKDFKVSRKQAIIVDEFHLLGGHKGQGWKKMDRLAKGLQAPLVICSATPNYNDAERVYCVMHVLAPDTVKGGYIQFLYQHCETTVNPFGQEPIVDGFRTGQTAEEFLAALPYVHYVEDEAIKQIVIEDIPAVCPDLPDELVDYGWDVWGNRIVASQMEEKHRIKRYRMLYSSGDFELTLFKQIDDLVKSDTGQVLIYFDSSELAKAFYARTVEYGWRSVIVHGTLSATNKHRRVQAFLEGNAQIMVGTATMATGLDGVDKVCDRLIIVDDTDDDAKRRQLMGRILPRGLDTDISKKTVQRLVFP